MTGDRHVPFCGGLGVKFPWATRLLCLFIYDVNANIWNRKITRFFINSEISNLGMCYTYR